MKNKLFLIALIIASMSLRLCAQSFPDPEFSGRPYILVSDSILKDAERATYTMDYKAKGFGYGGTETYYTVFHRNQMFDLHKIHYQDSFLKVMRALILWNKYLYLKRTQRRIEEDFYKPKCL